MNEEANVIGACAKLHRAGSDHQPRHVIRALILLSLAAAALMAMGGVQSWPPRPALLWNASPSSKIGLYRVRAVNVLRHGEMLVAYAPEPARRLAATRHYLPYDVPLVKPIAAVGGDRVCGSGANIWVNGRLAARRLREDSLSRSLPWWSGCRTLRRGEAFLLSAQVPSAFDGRYFGITTRDEIIGEALLLWSR